MKTPMQTQQSPAVIILHKPEINDTKKHHQLLHKTIRDEINEYGFGIQQAHYDDFEDYLS